MHFVLRATYTGHHVPPPPPPPPPPTAPAIAQNAYPNTHPTFWLFFQQNSVGLPEFGIPLKSHASSLDNKYDQLKEQDLAHNFVLLYK